MFDLTILDWIYVGVVLASTIWATIRGGVYETVATMSWIIAALTSRFVSPYLDGVFQNWFNLAESTIGTLIAAYFIVFFVILLVFGFVAQKLRDRVQDSVMSVTDHTLGVVFGIIRGIIVMGLVYWAMLWYYSESSRLPDGVAAARTRPVMQLTAVKIGEWFIPGEHRLLNRDMTGTVAAAEIYEKLINPKIEEKPAPEESVETGYKSSERTALENQLLQIETTAE